MLHVLILLDLFLVDMKYIFEASRCKKNAGYSINFTGTKWPKLALKKQTSSSPGSVEKTPAAPDVLILGFDVLTGTSTLRTRSHRVLGFQWIWYYQDQGEVQTPSCDGFFFIQNWSRATGPFLACVRKCRITVYRYTNLCVSMHHVLIYTYTWRSDANHTVTVITLDQIKWSVCSYLSKVYRNIDGETTAKHDIRILNLIPPEMILNEGILQLPSIMKHFHNHDFKIIWIMGWPASDHAVKCQLIHLF